MPEVPPVAPASTKVLSIDMILRNLRQGDVISLGAVNLVGVGKSEAWASAAHEGVTQAEPAEGIWALTIESDAGWYVIITQDCDLVRSPDIEPCIVVCPVKYVTPENWTRLRNGPGSPREFPLPDDDRVQREGMQTVADLRWVTSIDKTALLHPSVEIIHPLNAPQRANFARWVGARYARVPHSDELEEKVLRKAATTIQGHAKKFGKNDLSNPITRLVGAVDSWYIAGNDKMIDFIAVTSASSLKRGKWWIDASASPNQKALDKAVSALTDKLRAGLPDNSGYVCKVRVTTLDSIRAAEFLSWSEWVIEKNGDPLV